MRNALLIELAETWELQAATGGDGLNKLQPPACGMLRACADTLRMLVDSDKPREQDHDKCRELLSSARAIAERKGAGTAWERFAASIAALGISGVTPRTYRVLPDDEPATAAASVQQKDVLPLHHDFGYGAYGYQCSKCGAIWSESNGKSTNGPCSY